MRPQTFAVTAGTLLVMALLLVVTGRPKAPPVKPEPPPPVVRLLTVTGEGEVRVTPEVAYLVVHLRTHGASAAEAEALHAASVASLLSVVSDEVGLAEADVEAPRPTLRSVTGQNWIGEVRIVGYEASSEALVVVRQLEHLPEVVARLLAAGISEIDQVLYGLADVEPVRRSAMQQAMASAQDRAAALAQVAHVKLTGLHEARAVLEEVPPRSPILAAMPAPFSTSPDLVVVRVQVEATYTAE